MDSFRSFLNHKIVKPLPLELNNYITMRNLIVNKMNIPDLKNWDMIIYFFEQVFLFYNFLLLREYLFRYTFIFWSKRSRAGTKVRCDPRWRSERGPSFFAFFTLYQYGGASGTFWPITYPTDVLEPYRRALITPTELLIH